MKCSIILNHNSPSRVESIENGFEDRNQKCSTLDNISWPSGCLDKEGIIWLYANIVTANDKIFKQV